MPRGLGFGALAADKILDDHTEALTLPPRKQVAANPTPLPKEALGQESVALGFVSREPTKTEAPSAPTRRKGRPRSPQGKLLIAGRKSVLDEFQQLCWEHDLAYWEGLQMLLEGAGVKKAND